MHTRVTKTYLWLTVVTALSACSPVAIEPLRADHPAHPEASAPTAQHFSETLTISKDDAIVEEKGAPASGHEGHAGMHHEPKNDASVDKPKEAHHAH